MRILTWREIQVIEQIVRQGWLDSADPLQAEFSSWLEVDQEQALALLEHISGRMDVEVKLPPSLTRGQALRRAITG